MSVSQVNHVHGEEGFKMGKQQRRLEESRTYQFTLTQEEARRLEAVVAFDRDGGGTGRGYRLGPTLEDWLRGIVLDAVDECAGANGEAIAEILSVQPAAG